MAFFGTDNLHRAGWGILLAIIGFIVTQAYQYIHGPQKVVVETEKRIFSASNKSGGEVADSR